MTHSMYQQIFGGEFGKLPEEIRAMHVGTRKAVGRANVTRGTSPLARLICAAAKIPASGENVVVETSFDPVDNGERWTRRFGDDEFHTEMKLVRVAPHAELTEQFGPLKFRLRLTAHEHGVDMTPEGVSVFGLPLPRFLCPEAVGLERVRDGKYHFDVTVRFPVAGDIITYAGWLEPAA